MNTSISFLSFELRRHMPTLWVGWSLLVVIPLVHRLVEGRWNFWDGEWNFAAAAIGCLGIAPFLTLAMAISGWAAERSAIVLWLSGTSPRELFLWVSDIHPRLGLLWIDFLALALGGGSLVSALISTPGLAWRAFLFTSLILGVLIPEWLLWMVPTRQALFIDGQDLLALGSHVYTVILAAALAAETWSAMGRSPGDSRRIRRVLKSALPLALVGREILLTDDSTASGRPRRP